MTATEQPPVGFGRLTRKEDGRFVRGQGTFVDDVRRPGMLHGAILRSPLAHARVVSIDASAALQHPRVHAVITGAELARRGLAWMPTMSSDTQAVLATDKVRFQGQEVAFAIADDRYSARDALELIDVEYEALAPVVEARSALHPGAPLIRDDKPGQRDNRIFDWESGDEAATERVFARAEVVVEQEMVFPRSHPAPMETCGAVAEFDKVSGKLTVWCTTQAPHAHRTVYALLTGLPEHRIRVISPDVGGGFGNKVPVYPGYLCAIVGAISTGHAVKWIEDRSENLMSTGFARDFVMRGSIAATRAGKVQAVRVEVLADHGAFNATAQPTRYPAGFFNIFTGSYDIEAAHCRVRGVYTNKAPGGVAYACSFRIAEAVFLIERMVDRLAHELEADPAELRSRNLLRPEQFPYRCMTGWVYDSGDYERALRAALELAGYAELRREQADRRARGELMGIGLSFFTEAVGAGPRRHMDIMGLGMSDGASLRISPTGTAQLAIGVQSQGQGHETTFAQIVAEELGIAPEDVDVIHGDTDVTPYGLGTYGSRSTPVGGAAAALVARKVRERARLVASAMLEVAPEDLEWEKGRWYVKGDRGQGATLPEIAMASRGPLALPDGIEAGLDADVVYDPPNLTFPFGAYVCVVDIDPGTGNVEVRRFVAVDDCGTRINPMIIEGQVHGGLTDGVGIALMELLAFDAGHRRLAAGDRQRRLRRAGPVRRSPRRHAVHAIAGVGGDARAGAPRAVTVTGLVLAAEARGGSGNPGSCSPTARRRCSTTGWGLRAAARFTSSSASSAPAPRLCSSGCASTKWRWSSTGPTGPGARRRSPRAPAGVRARQVRGARRAPRRQGGLEAARPARRRARRRPDPRPDTPDIDTREDYRLALAAADPGEQRA